MAKCGADVVIWGLRAERNPEAAERLRAYGGRVLAQTVDVTDEHRSPLASTRRCRRWEGSTASSPMPASGLPEAFHVMTTEEYERVLAAAQHGAFFTCVRRLGTWSRGAMPAIRVGR